MAGGGGGSPTPEARSQGAGGGPALEDEVKEGDECGEEEAAGWYKVDGLSREATELFRRWKESRCPVSSSLVQFLREFWTFVTKGCECGCTDSGGGGERWQEDVALHQWCLAVFTTTRADGSMFTLPWDILKYSAAAELPVAMPPWLLERVRIHEEREKNEVKKVNKVNADVKEVKHDVKEVKTGVKEVKHDVEEVKQNMKEVEHDLKKDVNDNMEHDMKIEVKSDKKVEVDYDMNDNKEEEKGNMKKEGTSGKRRKRGGRSSKLRRLLSHQLLLMEKWGLPPSRLLCNVRSEARTLRQGGRREQAESASPLLRSKARRRESTAEEEVKVEIKEGVAEAEGVKVEEGGGVTEAGGAVGGSGESVGFSTHIGPSSTPAGSTPLHSQVSAPITGSPPAPFPHLPSNSHLTVPLPHTPPFKPPPTPAPTPTPHYSYTTMPPTPIIPAYFPHTPTRAPFLPPPTPLDSLFPLPHTPYSQG